MREAPGEMSVSEREKMRKRSVRTSLWTCFCNIPLEVPDLVTPLGNDPQSVLEEGDDDHEPADGGEVWFEWLRVNLNIFLGHPRIRANFLERVVWVGCPVSSGGACVAHAVRVCTHFGAVAASVWACDANA